MSLSLPARAFRHFLRTHHKPATLRRGFDPVHMRERVVQTLEKLPPARDVAITQECIDGVDLFRFTPPSASTAAVIFYLHGGGYTSGSPRTHRAFISRLARQSGCEVWAPDYRLAPEHPFPAGLNDAHALWQRMAERHPGKRLLLGGESAGGGLSIALSLTLRDTGGAMPFRVYLSSPWLDLTLSGESYRRLTRSDVLVSTELIHKSSARHYAPPHLHRHPLVSPVFADLTGLPPLLIQVSDAEIFHSDSVSFEQRARQAGVTVSLQTGRGLWHAWPLFAPLVPESNRALRDAANWLVTG
jgi:monoterpene epsilon-lactone hydrolase